MKRLILILIVFTNVSSFGQRLNRQGEKMVSTIDTEKFTDDGRLHETKSYKFTYDSNDRLVSVECYIKEFMGKTIKCVSERRIIITNKKGIYRKDYKNDVIDKTCTYRYDCDDGLIIRSGETYQSDEYRWISDIRNKYVYDNGVLTEIVRQWFGKYVNQKDYENSNERYHYSIGYISGNPYSRSKDYQREGYFDDLFDDTNININALVWDKMGQISITDDNIELCTEWIPFKAVNLLKFSGYYDNMNGCYNLIDYEYDKFGNIEFIFVKNTINNAVNRKIRLSYLY